MRKTALMLATVIGAATLPALAMASPMQEARAHLHAIAKADVPAIMADYAPNAVFQWVGGPLDGNYEGTPAIQSVWRKFTHANGPIHVKIDDMEVAANPKGATVTADVIFKGAKPIPVRYVMTFRQGVLVNEIWQIDPKLMHEMKEMHEENGSGYSGS
ncbi:nuclear transport factor 2 family protein [Acidihalobacter ferrooxydans]|uniref:SnoaL-like domain-containing protein n=1 Tax=Acidihalobacter ferrooxydans TaxID=1765967 RepID=A0A1P8UJG9_9GAMM|nr:nuclear transport factor 2 family protein [Acidihalobacter ferrooxydans]APZ43950.1 hypothetical protein BW247_13320 [Acidihalobacter ferrooxydans]